MLIVDSQWAEAVAGTFDGLLEAGFPIKSVRPVSDYNADDDRSMADNNTSGFNCRPVGGSNRWSQHSYGLAIDINALPDQGCALEPCWGDTPHAQWLAANAYRFGFIVRYPDGKTDITGYEYEPYHMRYVGIELATEMHNTGITTLEEFFGLPPAPDYAG